MQDTKKTTGELIGTALVMSVITFFLGGFMLMEFMDFLHGVWSAVPALGYWTSAAIMFFGRNVSSGLFNFRNES